MNVHSTGRAPAARDPAAPGAARPDAAPLEEPAATPLVPPGVANAARAVAAALPFAAVYGLVYSIANTLMLPRSVTPEQFAEAGSLAAKFQHAGASVKHHFGLGTGAVGSGPSVSGTDRIHAIADELCHVARMIDDDPSLRVIPAVDHKLPLLVLLVGLLTLLAVYCRIGRRA